jgi:hypothetical protein
VALRACNRKCGIERIWLKEPLLHSPEIIQAREERKSHEETAAALGISVNTVCNHMKEALRTLRGRLARHDATGNLASAKETVYVVKKIRRLQGHYSLLPVVPFNRILKASQRTITTPHLRIAYRANQGCLTFHC